MNEAGLRKALKRLQIFLGKVRDFVLTVFEGCVCVACLLYLAALSEAHFLRVLITLQA